MHSISTPPIRLLLIALAAALAPLTACDEVKVSDRDLTTVGEQRVAEAIEDPETVIVDVRPAERYEAGHIPSAINIFLPDIRASDPRLATAQSIIVYGNTWTDPLATAAAKKLIALGYTNVNEFRGGIELWQDAGYELATPEN